LEASQQKIEALLYYSMAANLKGVGGTECTCIIHLRVCFNNYKFYLFFWVLMKGHHYVFNKIRLLWEMNRREEAAAEWLTVRGYSTIIHHPEQLEQLLQTLETKMTQ
jgi:hypothetical protein